MKKLSTQITDKNGVEKTITVFVDDETAAVLEECDEDFRRFYILEEHKDYNRTRAETRRHISYESFTEQGIDMASNEENPAEQIIRLEVNAQLHKAMESLTEKQRQALWLVAVDELSFHEAGAKMGVRWETVREHYEAAIKKVRKNF